MTTDHGLCDLSLRLEGVSEQRPVIFNNRNLRDSKWAVVFKDDFKKLVAAANKSRTAGICGVFYQTDNKMRVSKDDIHSDLLQQPFPPAKKLGVPLRYLDVVLHCEAFFRGGRSVAGLPQEEAWRQISQGWRTQLSR
jgi:hypothetical protein